MAVAQVQRVVQERLIIRADIQGHRDHAARVDPGGGGVDGQLPDRNLDATDSPVTDAENLLGVGAHDEVDVVGPEFETGEGALDGVRAVDGQEDAAGTAELVRVRLDRVTDRGVVHDRQQLDQVVGQDLVVQHLVPVVEPPQVYVLGQ